MRASSLAVILLNAVIITNLMASEYQGSLELRLNGIYYSPSGDAVTGDIEIDPPLVWDDGQGAEVQLIWWFPGTDETFGMGFAGGRATWAVEDYQEYYYDFGYMASREISGDMDLTSFGMSMFLKPAPQLGVYPAINPMIEFGWRYVEFDSSVESYTYVTDGRHSASGSGDFDITSAMVGVIALNLEIRTSETLSLFAGGGYQFDSRQAKVLFDTSSGDSYPAGEIELVAVFGRAGICLVF